MKKDFLNISPESGGSTQVSVTADPNLSFSQRSTTLNFSSTGGVWKRLLMRSNMG